MTYKHYLQQLRQAIENNLKKKLDQNPNLIKLFDSFPQPVSRYILLKYWGFHHKGLNGGDCICHPYEWRNIEPNLHPIHITNHA